MTATGKTAIVDPGRPQLTRDNRAAASAAIRELAREAARCEKCPLFARATQTVFGEGPVATLVALVGEQPGDVEDRAGRPFVGPAGAVLSRALEAAGLDRSDVYVTNAVKHFKWEERGKRRLHKKPSRTEVVACRPWLEAELSIVMPRVTVALGATAGSSLLGPSFRVGASRGKVEQVTVGEWSGPLVATIHPSAVLRAKDDSSRADLREDLTDALRLARRLAGAEARAPASGRHAATETR